MRSALAGTDSNVVAVKTTAAVAAIIQPYDVE
jgi:hypothetical protein